MIIFKVGVRRAAVNPFETVEPVAVPGIISPWSRIQH